MNVLTVHFALSPRGRLRSGETALVHGAGGGIGIAATQYATAVGARVIAVTSTEEKRVLARKDGASEAIPTDGFKDAAEEINAGKGDDIVVTPVRIEHFTA